MCESDFDVCPQVSSDSGSNDSLKRSSVAAKVLLSPWNQTQGASGSESVVGQTWEVDRFPRLLVDGFFEGW